MIFGILNYFEIQTQFYIWEILVDLKTLALVLLLAIFSKKQNWKMDILPLIKIWNTYKNFLFFFLPVIFAGVVVIVGIIFNKIEYRAVENTTTLILTTLFDIPSIFVFSVTTFLVEEFVFRGFIFAQFQKNSSIWYSFVASSLIWTLYSFSDIPLHFIKGNGSQFILIFFYLFSIGFFSSAVYLLTQSIWCSYSFRVGTITLIPLVLTLLSGENDSFFVTEQYLFYGDGILFSSILLSLSIIFLVYFRGKNKLVSDQNKTA